MATVLSTNFTILYNNRNITEDISRYLLSLTYSDKTEGESDEISIDLEDVDNLWTNNWYPEKGASLTVTIGLLNCGVFEIDEIETKGPPTIVSIKGMATGLKTPLRTRNSDAHENKTLKQIVEKIALKNNLTVSGDIPEISIGRVTQNKETDLAFLKRISRKYGVMFSVRGNSIIFTSVVGIEQRGISFTVDKSELSGYNLKDKADGMIKAAKVKSKNAKENEKVEVNVEFEQWKQQEGYKYDSVNSQDDGVSDTYVENKQQGEAVAKAIMHTSATNQQEGNISMAFNPYAVAGNNFTLEGLGKLSGKYHIKASTHKIDRSGGGTTELDIKRLQTPDKSQQITNKPKQQQPKSVPVSAASAFNRNQFIIDPLINT